MNNTYADIHFLIAYIMSPLNIWDDTKKLIVILVEFDYARIIFLCE
jgi:hypothetical protein